jgi:hypothetical protein
MSDDTGGSPTVITDGGGETDMRSASIRYGSFVLRRLSLCKGRTLRTERVALDQAPCRGQPVPSAVVRVAVDAFRPFIGGPACAIPHGIA